MPGKGLEGGYCASAAVLRFDVCKVLAECGNAAAGFSTSHLLFEWHGRTRTLRVQYSGGCALKRLGLRMRSTHWETGTLMAMTCHRTPARAVQWHTAEAGYAEAQCNLGVCYASDTGKLKSVALAKH